MFEYSLPAEEPPLPRITLPEPLLAQVLSYLGGVWHLCVPVPGLLG